MDHNQIKMIYQALSILPQMEVAMRITGEMPQGESVFLEKSKKSKRKSDGLSEEKNLVKNLKIVTSKPDKIYELFEDEDYVLNLDIKRINWSKSNQAFRAYCPKFNKPKDENWVAILGLYSDEDTSELLGLKRINSFKMSQNSSLSFRTPAVNENNKTEQFAMTLFLMSDVYLGLDQQYELKFKLKKKIGFY